MIVLEFKDGPNKGKQVVLPTPDDKPCNIDTLPDDNVDATAWFEQRLASEKGKFKSNRGRSGTINPITPKPSLWKRFWSMFRR